MMAPNLTASTIVLVNLGTIRSVEGHEQALTRPCLVIKSLNKLKLATVTPLSTSKPPTAAGPVIKISKGVANLKSDSFVLLHQIRTISTNRIEHDIGQLPEAQFVKIQLGLKHFLEL